MVVDKEREFECNVRIDGWTLEVGIFEDNE